MRETGIAEIGTTYFFVRFEVFTAVTMKNGVFWVLTRATRRNNPEDTILFISSWLASVAIYG
jgi:hypothetical protein